MFDSLRVNPRLTPKKQQLIKRNEDEAKQQATGNDGDTTLAQSRGLQYVENLQSGNSTPKNVATAYQNNYAYNNQVQNAKIATRRPSRPIQNNSVTRTQARPVQVQQQAVNSTQAQATNATSATSNSYLATHSPKINIAQVIGDFKNTASAIGTPDDTNEEVNAYLDLVEKQTKKDNANVKLVQSNLRNAATLLDGYISKTLNKDSKVVENWVEAIFLQQVDYSYNTKDVNEAFLVKMPEDKKAKEAEKPAETEQVEVKPEKPQVDAELKNLFVDAKKAAKSNDSITALKTFDNALKRSIAVDDKSTQSKIYFEVGQVYDKEDNLHMALQSYNKSAETATDDNVKVKAHYSMAQIYDDVNMYKPAIEHYMAAVAFAGETENFKAQTKSLTKIGNIYTDKYDKEAFNIYEEAETLADESKDLHVKGYVSSTIASAYDKFNKPAKALKYYSDAVQNYSKVGADEKVAQNYRHAGELMKDYQKGDKGKNLIQKALLYAQKANNDKLVSELKEELVA